MSFTTNPLKLTRRTAADELFDNIRSDIEGMRLLPGTKITEAEVAKRYEVSRQPVREAFIRLHNISLLQIQPQKATIVKRISRSAIRQTRFVRTAVEIEVARKACHADNARGIGQMETLLAQQQACLEKKDISRFSELDLEYHRQICVIADCDFAIEVIEDCKTKISRLCVLSLANSNDSKQIYDDHVKILKYLARKEEEKLVQSIRRHLSRLDTTIDQVQTEHSHYFED